jgi:cytochrome c peroxidase
MFTSRLILFTTLTAALASACGAPTANDISANDAPQTSALTAQDRLTACNSDPRVVAGLVTAQICAGADIFFRETFNGNGRTCGTCHPSSHNFTIDGPFVQQLEQTNPNDPLFVFKNNAALSTLETPFLEQNGGVLENVDGFEDLTNKFVVRGVPHLLALATSITPDPADGEPTPPVARVGWGGDGAPGDGSLRAFLNGAITQHYPKTLARTVGVDFRLATDQELDLVLAFQMNLGRLNELDINQVNMFDAAANEGRRAFIDPARGRCNECHANAGANSLPSGKNRNFDTRTRMVNTFGAVPAVFDGGFGGKGLSQPNFDAVGAGFLNSFGDGTFSTAPLIEAADTAPFFHTNTFTNMEGATGFYRAFPFSGSPADQILAQKFNGQPISFSNDDSNLIARFLRGLNIALNLDMALQRLSAAQTLVNRFHNTRADIQQGLMRLAENELNDALGVLTDAATPQPFYPVAVDRIGLAKQEIDAAIAATDFSIRQGHLSTGYSRVLNARDQIGANITFRLGTGDLMF